MSALYNPSAKAGREDVHFQPPAAEDRYVDHYEGFLLEHPEASPAFPAYVVSFFIQLGGEFFLVRE